ncbi:hypothetical protein ACEN8I_01060 [Polaromonas sp. CT11-55]|uniref:hypothetical protein n=1 Tax=Polaromonas sp. CT11-55 TaxID=3243045 RepID=UPI0039A55B39
MPGSPRIDKGEGFIRSHDLMEVLLTDINSAYEVLEADRQSQYLRRCVVRAVFSFIEAAVECVKVELRSSVRLGHYSEELLTPKERETLGPLTIIGGRPGKFLTLDENLKRTFKLAAKIWLLDFRLSTDGPEFVNFLAAKSARNRLTHPRTVYDVEVTDHDMHYHTTAGHWVRSEFVRLFHARLQSLTQGLPEEDRQVFFLGKVFGDGGGNT